MSSQKQEQVFNVGLLTSKKTHGRNFSRTYLFPYRLLEVVAKRDGRFVYPMIFTPLSVMITFIATDNGDIRYRKSRNER